MILYYDYLNTPIGVIEISSNDTALTSIYFVDRAGQVNANEVSLEAKKQLQEYFSGDRKEFDLPLEAHGTEFQKRVWSELVTIEFGETCTYGDIAKQLDNPKGMRAVGLANGKNPISIVVPCHRVIGANGKLTGYASGVDKKAWLLNHESDSLF